MSNDLFVDTGYVIVLINHNDQYLRNLGIQQNPFSDLLSNSQDFTTDTA